MYSSPYGSPTNNMCSKLAIVGLPLTKSLSDFLTYHFLNIKSLTYEILESELK